METKEIVIKLSAETFCSLEKSALNSGKTPEELAARLISDGMAADTSTAKASFPSVALLKNSSKQALTRAFLPDAPTETTFFEPIQSTTKPIRATPGVPLQAKPTVSNFLSPEKMQRKQQIEEEMRELSLLIDTATEDKKEEYLLRYAMLAAEHDGIA